MSLTICLLGIVTLFFPFASLAEQTRGETSAKVFAAAGESTKGLGAARSAFGDKGGSENVPSTPAVANYMNRFKQGLTQQRETAAAKAVLELTMHSGDAAKKATNVLFLELVALATPSGAKDGDSNVEKLAADVARKASQLFVGSEAQQNQNIKNFIASANEYLIHLPDTSVPVLAARDNSANFQKERNENSAVYLLTTVLETTRANPI